MPVSKIPISLPPPLTSSQRAPRVSPGPVGHACQQRLPALLPCALKNYSQTPSLRDNLCDHGRMNSWRVRAVCAQHYSVFSTGFAVSNTDGPWGYCAEWRSQTKTDTIRAHLQVKPEHLETQRERNQAGEGGMGVKKGAERHELVVVRPVSFRAVTCNMLTIVNTFDYDTFVSLTHIWKSLRE